MVRKLTKKDKSGQTYTRPAEIEQSISATLIQSPSSWIERAAVSDHRSAEYLAPEVVVHLIRHSLRMQDFSTTTLMLDKFGKQLARRLERQVKESRAFNAAIVREETLSRFMELFAEDLNQSGQGILDFYEIRFDSAFATLRAQVIRYERLRAGPLESLSADGPRYADDDEPEPIELPDLSPEADIVTIAENVELYRLVQALPADERDAILWKYYDDLDTESTDPSKATVATRAGVSGSEIRSRLRAAYARLKKQMEEKS